MRVLVAGFERAAADRISATLRGRGHHVLGATGRSSARALAGVVRPDCVLAPSGQGGDVSEWLDGVLAGVLVVESEPDTCLARLEAATGGPAAGGAPDQRPPTPSEPPSWGADSARSVADRTTVLPPELPASPGPPWGAGLATGADPMGSGTGRDAGRGAEPVTLTAEPQPSGHPSAGRPASESDPQHMARPGGSATDDAQTARAAALSPEPLPAASHPAAGEPGGSLRAELAGGGPSHADIAAARQTLARKLDEVRFADYFTLLEVHRGASTYVLREQHQHLARRYSPDGWPGTLTPETVRDLVEVGRGLDDAFTLLVDPTLRARYVAGLSDAPASRS